MIAHRDRLPQEPEPACALRPGARRQHMVDTAGPNNPSDKEKAEGSRDTVNAGLEGNNPMEQGEGQESHPERPVPPKPPAHDTGGITNRPLSEELENQHELPPRGESKEGR